MDDYSVLGLEMTFHYPVLGIYGNWFLAMCELFAREPLCQRYVVFEDDILACSNLREYLERCPYPEDGFWNCYTSSDNHNLLTTIEDRGVGWILWNVRSNFDRAALPASDEVSE